MTEPKIIDCWKAAVDRELTTFGLTADDFDSPEKAIQALIEWNVRIATDPQVNGGFELVPVKHFKDL